MESGGGWHGNGCWRRRSYFIEEMLEDLGSGSSIAESTMVVLEGDVEFSRRSVQLAPRERQRATAITLVERSVQPFELSPNHPHVERKIVTDHHRAMQTCREAIDDLFKGRGTANHGRRNSVDVGSANITLGVHQRVKFVDRLESARIQNDDCHLDDPVMAAESRGFRIDDCVVRHGSLVHPGNRPLLAVYADRIGSICNIRRHSP